LRVGADESDGVIHTAFIHDFSKFEENCLTDRRAIEAIGSALAGSYRPFVISSGTALLPSGRVGTEDDTPGGTGFAALRGASEELALSFASRGVRVSVLRLPPTVHGDGDHGFVPLLIKLAREKGLSAYVGEGRNRWPAVHRLDAAELYPLALEKAPPGTRFHGVGEEGVAFRDIAEVIGRRLSIPVASKSPAEAAEHFGWFAHFASLDNPTSSARTRQNLGWHPKHAGLIADLDREQYFKY
jgi:nucleoside-diphosphate-sugar epimerase